MDGMVKVRLVRSCELHVGNKIYRQGDELAVDDEQLAQLGDMVQRLDAPQASLVEDNAPQAEPASKKTRAKKS